MPPTGRLANCRPSGADGKRYTIRLGDVAEKHAKRVHTFIENLEDCRLSRRSPDSATAEWLRDAPERVLYWLERAGLTPWPKLFQNCRSTRETESAESYPVQVVTSWLGNSPAVVRKHYLQVTEDHYRRALAEGALQKAVQSEAHEPEQAK